MIKLRDLRHVFGGRQPKKGNCPWGTSKVRSLIVAKFLKYHHYQASLPHLQQNRSI